MAVEVPGLRAVGKRRQKRIAPPRHFLLNEAVRLVPYLLLATLVHAAPLPHAAYVWQRQWDEHVRAAVSNAAPCLSGFVVLAGENHARFAPDLAAVHATGKPCGVAFRLTTLATLDLTGFDAAEIQIDYDCPESKLDAYRQWLVPFRAKVAPTPVTITALPAWLRQPAFSNLVAASDGFVLQVHSFDTTLCDTGKAARAVAEAARYGVPFRVALPTYGYVVAHDLAGKFLGLSAEGPARNWPADSVLSEVRTDPAAMAALVREWSAHRPANLTGIIWYRLPIATDRLNWRWPTLAAIIAGKVPQPALVPQLRQPEPGLVELDLANTGNADAFTNVTVTVRWRDATLLACDALAGFAITGTETNAARFVGNPRVAPGERRVAGWLRFRETKEVACEVRVE